jgi:hypothetical protein
MKNYFERIINEERGRKFRVHGLNIYSHQERRFEEVEEIEDFKKSKFAEVEDMKKSKFEEIEV